MMSGLTNAYLETISYKLLGKKIFVGVYSADGCSKVFRKKYFSIIFNTDLMKNPGKHFISILFTPSRAYYFDSLGQKKIEKNISKFIQKTKRKCVTHCLPIQDETSNFCGFYALAYLLWMKKKRRSTDFYKMFDMKCLIKNDSIVTKFILNEIE